MLNMRLKKFEETFIDKNIIRINNSVFININYIKSFQSLKNARIEVVLEGGIKYFVSRYYIKNFRERLL
ncbi:LytTR family DNA-binding domain-containing protein [Miniphocaeibacter massiliensis]|uniref:LytTR family DNA-binding domain-containing protein n=1 Tax=Miniphocaeibacter massiliensis TaxID=2041841 RepID=UPI000C1BD786|nr:LytTR family DNA-binding domain-containing protein [Miniphocaeibacter massiliensis]